jgi:hypothetical protein
MTAKEYVESFGDSRGFWDKNKASQAYIIALGVNDLNRIEIGSVDDVDLKHRNNNKPTFAGYYATIIQKYKEIQPRAKFFFVTIPKHGDQLDEKRKAVRDLLSDFTKIFDRSYLIDLYTYAPIYDEEFHSKYFLGHMNPMGYVLTARMIESYIDYIIRTNLHDFSQVGFIGTDLYYEAEET